MKPQNRQIYHYTKCFDVLSHHILKEGFWPQYSLEDFSWIQNGKPLYLAFPCVCFTELPLDQSQMHRDDYGKYVIGFNSDWKTAGELKPLRYVQKPDEASPLLKVHHCRAMTKCGDMDTSEGLMYFPPTKLNPKDFDGVWEILPYLKERLGFTLQRLPKPRGNRTHDWVPKFLKDELEWRYIPENHRENLFSVVDDDAKTMKALETLNDVMHDSHLKFDPSEVSIVIVTTEAEREQLAAIHPNLDCKIRVWDEVPKPKADDGKPIVL